MPNNKYVGARYVPKFDGAWDSTKSYEPLIIVEHQGNSYTSKTYVPAGVDIGVTTYWALTGNYNAQVEQYRKEVLEYKNEVNAVKDSFAEKFEQFTQLFNEKKAEFISFFNTKKVELEELIGTVQSTINDVTKLKSDMSNASTRIASLESLNTLTRGDITNISNSVTNVATTVLKSNKTASLNLNLKMHGANTNTGLAYGTETEIFRIPDGFIPGFDINTLVYDENGFMYKLFIRSATGSVKATLLDPPAFLTGRPDDGEHYQKNYVKTLITYVV